MKKMMIYEPAMCSETGVCGADVDPELLRVSAFVEKLRMDGVDIVRYNLTSAPQEFETNQLVNEAIHIEGTSVLPITIVDDEIVKTGSYPTNEEFIIWSNVIDIISNMPAADEMSMGCSSCAGCSGCGSANFDEDDFF